MATPVCSSDQGKLPQSVAVADAEPGFPACVQHFLHKTIVLEVTLTLPTVCSSSVCLDN